jgi:hypothetical protein
MLPAVGSRLKEDIMLRPLLLALTAAADPRFAPSGVAHAAGTPAQICAGAKQKAAGTAAGASLSCHAKAPHRGHFTRRATRGILCVDPHASVRHAA